MAKEKYIRSNSLYTLKEIHKKTNDGIVYENDHITIIPNDGLYDDEMYLFSDSNFKYRIRTDNNDKKKHVKSPWVLNDSGDTWTLNTINSAITSNESKIVTKPNYSSLRDFAYYGSAVELIRGTVNDMILRFPGGINYGDKNAPIVMVGDDTYYLVSNDFNIDCWSKDVGPENLKNPMRVLSASYKNYGLESAPIVNISGNCLCSIIGSVTIDGKELSVYKGADGENYLVSKIHDGKNIIKPKQEFIDSFWDTLDDFERVLLNRDSDPIYKATFETPFVNENGYFYDMKDYIWPTGPDNFTLDITSSRFQSYLESLLSLAEFHDSYDSDNIWRMMTHESIKNLDWTFTNNEGDEIDDTIELDSGRLEKLIHVQGRLYDDIKRNASNIKAGNSISYDEKNNVPDYFLSDIIENDGWEAKSVSNFGKSAVTDTIKYSATTLFVSGKTDSDINSAFQRRLALSSNYINSMKGTRRGLETMLGMFGYSKDTDYDIIEYTVSATSALNYCDFVKMKAAFSYIYSEEISEYEYLKDYPVAVRIDDSSKDMTDWKIIPWFDSTKQYLDDKFYFQSKGGWGKTHERYISRPDITSISAITGNSLYMETEPYMLYVTKINDMLETPSNKLFNGVVCYVEDITNLANMYEDGSDTTALSHYFILENVAFSTILGIYSGETDGEKFSCNGWINVRETEYNGSGSTTPEGEKILYLESITTKERGNNPHTGKGNYDDGAEYFKYYKQLFKPDIDNGRYKSAEADVQSAITISGFTLSEKLIENNDKCVVVDDNGEILDESGSTTGQDSDLIINTKYLTIRFKTTDPVAKGYIKETVLIYLMEMIPSTTIVEILFDAESTLFDINNDTSEPVLSMNMIDSSNDTVFWGEDDTFYNNLKNSR